MLARENRSRILNPSNIRLIKIILFTSITVGVIAYGSVMFNKYSFHDEVISTRTLGATYTSGRWMLGWLSQLMELLFNGPCSVPVINTIVSLFFLSLCAFLLVKLFKIKRTINCFLISVVLLSTPVIAILFGFMFTAPYYMFALFLAVLGTALVCKYNNIWTFLLGVVCVAMSVGIYQAYIPVVLCIIVICLLKEYYETEKFRLRPYIFHLLKYFLFCVSFILLYFCVNKLVLSILHLELTDYQGINKMGQVSLPDLFIRVVLAYRNFFLPPKSIFSTKQLLLLYYLILCIVFVLSLMLIVRLFRKSKAFGITALVLLILFPIAINFIFVMSPEVHSLMLYAINLLFVYLVWLSEKIRITNKRIGKCAGVAIALCLLAMSATNIYISNECFLKAENIKSRLASNYTTLVTRIKSADGYKDSYPVAMINIENFHDDSWKDIEELNLKAMVYGRDSQSFFVDGDRWQISIAYYTGFCPEYAEPDSFINDPVVVSMPSYPDDGSIKVIDNTVIVKF